MQGVGFRPFVWQLAERFAIAGEVSNDAEGVLIRATGARLDAFVRALRDEAPPLAEVEAVEMAEADCPAFSGFRIVGSGAAGAETRVTPDAALCADCAEEIASPGRRRGYAFTNCTNCGPRFTILQGLPYDRGQTTMAGFAMCSECRSEYENPADRRFHAQPIACPACGPQLAFEPPAGPPLDEAVRRLGAGEIVALKGLGGFHLACDATSGAAIARLRERKRRPTKPLALMGTMEMIARHGAPTPGERARLGDPAAPIVLIARGTSDLPESVAPGMAELGWMLPYTPLHLLLLRAVGRPLVMTSGNLSGEPQVIGDDEARDRLGHIADGILYHNRPIARRLDDSVERVTRHGPMVLRRARGRVPGTFPLPEGFEDAPDVVAYGAHLKSAICLTKNGAALLSHHLGDLDDALTWEEFQKADADYAALFDHRPEAAASDLHPDYRSTRHAAATGLRHIRVQHHHAHLGACLAENGWPRDGGPVAGIVLDGLGLGADGTVWGGEVLLGDYTGFERRAWLRPAALPGGDAANREPWRNLLARLDLAGLSAAADELLAERPRALLRQAISAGVNAPMSSSAGRLFDAVAAALGFSGAQSFEGEAAMWLEAAARAAGPDVGDGYPLGVGAAEGVLDDTALWAGLGADLAAGTDRRLIAMRFHAGLAGSFARAARRLVETGAAEAVALTGGCFQNALLLDLVVGALDGVAVPVLHHTRVPANDGGLALGQALIAQVALESG